MIGPIKLSPTGKKLLEENIPDIESLEEATKDLQDAGFNQPELTTMIENLKRQNNILLTKFG